MADRLGCAEAETEGKGHGLIYGAFTDGRGGVTHSAAVMKTNYALAFAAFAALTLPVFSKGAQESTVVARPVADAPADLQAAPAKVQIAILLDTSSSMDGLIGQAKSQLWKVVNSFTEAKKDGQVPFVEVALFEYGNSGLHVGNNYIRQIEPLTRDLDEISRELFALSTNGGEEYCGAVIQRALGDLSWDSSKQTYKVIFIAGNEPFTQGSVDARQACKDAALKGIVVNAIHCGSREEGIQGAWNDGPALADGRFMNIDQDRAVAHIPSPQDKRISDLGIELNRTYIGYGSNREESARKQVQADTDAHANEKSGALVQRAISKASLNYDNGSWDLVDGVREKKVDLAKLPAAELPAAMKDMKPDERTAYVEKMATTRADLQKQIADLNREREEFVKAERAKQATAGEKTLDEAMVEATREQATKLGYVFAK